MFLPTRREPVGFRVWAGLGMSGLWPETPL
jgi:hypothetical protein